eukprot:2133270-Pleurochrysis_carterae.AAC.2
MLESHARFPCFVFFILFILFSSNAAAHGRCDARSRAGRPDAPRPSDHCRRPCTRPSVSRSLQFNW